MAVERVQTTVIAMTEATEGSRAPRQSIGYTTVAEKAKRKAGRLCIIHPLLNLAVKGKYIELKEFEM